MQLFVPLTGRTGSLLPPDVVIGVFAALFVATSTVYMVRVREGGRGVDGGRREERGR
jgi:hypothetical protein